MSLASQFLDELLGAPEPDILVTSAQPTKTPQPVPIVTPVTRQQRFDLQENPDKRLRIITSSLDSEPGRSISQPEVENTSTASKQNEETRFTHNDKLSVLRGMYKGLEGIVKVVKDRQFHVKLTVAQRIPLSILPTTVAGETFDYQDKQMYLERIVNPTFILLVDVKELPKPLHIREPEENVLRIIFYNTAKGLRAGIYNSTESLENHSGVITQHVLSEIEAPYEELPTMTRVMDFLSYRVKNFGSIQSQNQIRLDSQRSIGDMYLVTAERSEFFGFYGKLGGIEHAHAIVQHTSTLWVEDKFVSQETFDTVKFEVGHLRGTTAHILEERLGTLSVVVSSVPPATITIRAEDVFFHDLILSTGEVAQLQKIMYDDVGGTKKKQYHVITYPTLLKKVVLSEDVAQFLFTDNEEEHSLLESQELVHTEVAENPEEENNPFVDQPDMVSTFKDSERLSYFYQELSTTEKGHKDNVKRILDLLNINDSLVKINDVIKSAEDIKKRILEETKAVSNIFRPSDMKLMYLILTYQQLLPHLFAIQMNNESFDFMSALKTLWNRKYFTEADINKHSVWLSSKWFQFKQRVQQVQESLKSKQYLTVYKFMARNAIDYFEHISQQTINVNPEKQNVEIIALGKRTAQKNLEYIDHPKEPTIDDISDLSKNMSEIALGKRTAQKNLDPAKEPTMDDISKNMSEMTISKSISRRQVVLDKIKSTLEKKKQLAIENKRDIVFINGISFILDNFENLKRKLQTLQNEEDKYTRMFGTIQYKIHTENLTNILKLIQSKQPSNIQ